MSKVFTPGQKVFCIDQTYGRYAGEEGEAYLALNAIDLFTIWGVNIKTNLVTIREAHGTLSAERFVDAEKYLHKKEFESKLEDLIDS